MTLWSLVGPLLVMAVVTLGVLPLLIAVARLPKDARSNYAPSVGGHNNLRKVKG